MTPENHQSERDQAIQSNLELQAGDTISANVEGSTTVAVGKYITQIIQNILQMPPRAVYAILAILAVGFLVLNYWAYRQHASTQQVVAAIKETDTPVPTPTNTPIPTATPLSVATASSDETLIIIATFVDPQGSYPHREIRDAIEEEAGKLGLTELRYEIVPDVLERNDRERAQELGELYNATMVIWGEDTRVNIIANFLHLKEPDFEARDIKIEQGKGEFVSSLAKPDPYSTFIADDLPIQMSFYAFFAIGHTFYVAEEYDRAAATIEQAVELVADRSVENLSNAYFRLGWLYHKPLGDLHTAITDYDRAIELDPQFFSAYVARGVAYYDQGNMSAAITDYDRAIELNPQIAGTYYNRGNAYKVKGELETAMVNFDHAIELDPNDAVAYYNRGNAYKSQGDLGAAIDDYNHAIRLDPLDADTYYNRGNAYYAHGDLAKAMADFDRAIEIDPLSAVAYHNRGIAFRDQGNLKSAIIDFNRAIDLNPNDAITFYNRGNAYYDQGNWVVAISDFSNAIELDPDYVSAYINRGGVFYDLDEFKAAISDFDHVLKLEPKSVEAYINRGIAYKAWGEFEAAIADYNRAIELEPQIGLAYYNRGIILAEQGHLDTASRDFRTFLNLARRNGQYQMLWLNVSQWIEQLEVGNNPFKQDVEIILQYRNVNQIDVTAPETMSR